MWFEDEDWHRDFLHPLAVEGFCIQGLVDYQFQQTAPDTFEMLAEVPDTAKRPAVQSEMLRQMQGILREKQLDYVQFSVRFTDQILPNPRTGKKPLIRTSDSFEMEEAI